MSTKRIHGKRWCFTVNGKEGDVDGQGGPNVYNFIMHVFGNASDGPQVEPNLWEYIIAQREKGENGNVHIQGFVIFKKDVHLTWIQKHFWRNAHYEIARGSNKACAEYCRKDDTFFPFEGVKNSLFGEGRWEKGKLPERESAPKRDLIIQDAMDALEDIKQGYIRPREINKNAFFAPGFIQAYKLLTADILGPYRPKLKIITLIGPPGTGKSFAIHTIFGESIGRALYCNNGTWFQNPCAKVMVFEEFCGQIQLQRMLQYLDPYPLALEVKGGMAPAMYDTVVITSNTRPEGWYKGDEAGVPGKRTDSILALWDRLGFSNGAFVPSRTCGHYLEAPLGLSLTDTRKWFHDQIARIVDWVEPIEDEPEHEELRDSDSEISDDDL